MTPDGENRVRSIEATSNETKKVIAFSPKKESDSLLFIDKTNEFLTGVGFVKFDWRSNKLINLIIKSIENFDLSKKRKLIPNGNAMEFDLRHN